MGKHYIEIDEVEFEQLKHDLTEAIVQAAMDNCYPINNSAYLDADAGDLDLDVADFKIVVKQIVEERLKF